MCPKHDKNRFHRLREWWDTVDEAEIIGCCLIIVSIIIVAFSFLSYPG